MRADTFSTDSLSSDEDTTLHPVTFDHFYSEAAAFEKLLAVNGCIGTEDSLDTYVFLSYTLIFFLRGPRIPQGWG
jgi:hypothetical protein